MRWLLSFLTALVFLAIVLPMWSDYSVRAESHKILEHLESTKKEIEARLMNQRNPVNIGKISRWNRIQWSEEYLSLLMGLFLLKGLHMGK